MDIFWYRHVQFLGCSVLKMLQVEKLGWVGKPRPWLLVGFCQALGWFGSTDGCSVSAEKVPTLLFGGDMEVIVIQTFQMWLLENPPFHGYMLLLLLLYSYLYIDLGMILLPATAANEGLKGFYGVSHSNIDLIMSSLTSESNGIPWNPYQLPFFTRSHYIVEMVAWPAAIGDEKAIAGKMKMHEISWNYISILHNNIARYRNILNIGIST